MKLLKPAVPAVMGVVLCAGLAGCSQGIWGGRSVSPPVPTRVVLIIGDGMGPEEVRAAGMYLHGRPGTLSWESFPYHAEMATYSADKDVTDSAASATAMATGHKVNNGVISAAVPGDGGELETTLEHLASLGRSTGLVTTDVITGATPACFAAHSHSRGEFPDIGHCYLVETRPNVILGGAKTLTADESAAAGYTVVTDRTAMQSLNTRSVTHVVGLFGNGCLPYEYDYATHADAGYDNLPHLSEMARTALAILGKNPAGFFLMIEGGQIDHAGHGNQPERNVLETVELSKTVQVVKDWAAGRKDTLIIVTADHETGGMKVLRNNGQGRFPTVSWSTKGHTPVNVGAWAWGVNAASVTGVISNTDIHFIALGQPPRGPTTRTAEPRVAGRGLVPVGAGAATR
jgi:alkaline phosphatase